MTIKTMFSSKQKIFLTLLSVLIAMFSCEQPQESTNEDTVAIVNNQKISIVEFHEEKDFLINYLPIFSNVSFNQKELDVSILEQIIQKKLLLQEAAKKGVKVNDGEFTNALERATSSFLGGNITGWLEPFNMQIEAWQEKLREYLILQKLTLQEIDNNIAITEKDALTYYQAAKSEFMLPQMRLVSHLQVDSQELINLVVKEFKRGQPFTKLVEAYSTSFDRLHQGNLGWVSADTLPANLSEAVFKITKKGALSDIVKTGYGFHVFLLKDIQPSKQLTFQEAKADIENKLKAIEKNIAFNNWLEKLKKQASIERYLVNLHF